MVKQQQTKCINGGNAIANMAIVVYGHITFFY